MGTLSSKSEKYIKPKPPLPTIPSLDAAAIILSYFAHEDLVKILLR